MARVDGVDLVMMVMVVMAMVVMPMMRLEPAEALARTPEHSGGDAEDDRARGDEHPGFEVRGQDLATKRQAEHRHDPDDQRVRKGGADAEKDGLSDGAADRDDVDWLGRRS